MIVQLISFMPTAYISSLVNCLSSENYMMYSKCYYQIQLQYPMLRDSIICCDMLRKMTVIVVGFVVCSFAI